MSRIAELIEEQCPNGVEYKPLGEIAQLVRGNGMPKTDFTESGVGAIHYGQIYTKFGVWAEDVISYVSEEKAAKLAKVNPGDIIITNTSENLDDVCKSVAWLGDEQIVTGGHATVIKHQQNAKFLSYYFQSVEFQKLKKKYAFGTKVIDVSAKNLGKIKVPVPPLKIQEEIVRILDRFTLLEAELEAELEARRKQYAFYRDSLLNFENRGGHTNVYELQDVLTIKNGKDYKHLPNGSVPVYGSGGVMLSVSDFIYSGPSVLIPRKGSLGNLFYVDQPFWVVDTIFYTVIDTRLVLPKYVYYYLKKLDLASLNTAGGVPSLTQSVLKKIKIPAPTLKEQVEIVEVLDRFDELVNSISSGLPAEIAARRKQYEYYRDQLLTFKELQPEAA